MFSSKIVPYQPNAVTRARRIDPKDWEAWRSRLEELYVNDDRKLEEVTEIMALNHSFYASRRQYTQKFNEWGLCKKFPAKVMKSALHKRARAGEHDVSIKYRGTLIAKENMDRWQRRVPTFNPFSSPTASTPSQLNVDSPHVALSPQQGDPIQSLVGQSLPINPFPETNVDFDDAVINVAHHEVRRSVSPQVAQYVFQRKDSSILPIKNSLTAAGWTSMSILAVSMNENELLQMTEENLEVLRRLKTNIWNLGNDEHLIYCAHIEEVLLVRESLSTPVNPNKLNREILAVAQTYLRMERYPECEALLSAVITETDLSHSDDLEGNRCLSFLGKLRSKAGQHDSVVDLCSQAVRSLRSAVGLCHHKTWTAHAKLVNVLRNQGKFEDGRRLMLKFYGDVYQSVSTRLLPGLRVSLKLCEYYIEPWISELRLQRLVKSHYLSDNLLDILGRHALVLNEVVVTGFWEGDSRPILGGLTDLKRLTGLEIRRILKTSVILINRRIKADRLLEPSCLRQEALRVIKDLKVTKFLVPVFILTLSTLVRDANEAFELARQEQDVIDFLKTIVTEPINSAEAYIPTSSEDAGSSGSASVAGEAHDSSQIDWLNGPENYSVLSRAASRRSLPEASAASHSLFSSVATVDALPSSPPVQLGFQHPGASSQIRTQASLEHAADSTPQPVLSPNMERSFPWSLSPNPSRQLSSGDQSQHWFSPSATFLPPPLYQEHQPLVDAPLQNPVLADDDLYFDDIDQSLLGTEASSVPHIPSSEAWKTW